MFQVQVGGQVSNSSLPGQNFHLLQGPYSNPSHCNRQGLQFGDDSLGSYHFQILVNGKSEKKTIFNQNRWGQN